MSCNSTFECSYCGNSTIGPLVEGEYYLTPCFEATVVLFLRCVATFFVVTQICYTWSLPSLHFLRSRVAFASSVRRRAPRANGGALSSIASGSIASALLSEDDGAGRRVSGGAFKMTQPLLDRMDHTESGTYYPATQSSRRKSTVTHQEAALARFPGVPHHVLVHSDVVILCIFKI